MTAACFQLLLMYFLAIHDWFSLCKIVSPPNSDKICSWDSLTDDFSIMSLLPMSLLDKNYDDIKPADVGVSPFLHIVYKKMQ